MSGVYLATIPAKLYCPLSDNTSFGTITCCLKPPKPPAVSSMGPAGNAPLSTGNDSLRKGPANAKTSRKFTANEKVRPDRPSYAEPDDYFSPPRKSQRSTAYASPLLFTDEEEELRRSVHRGSPLTEENLQNLQAAHEADSAATDPRFEDPVFLAFMRKSNKSRSSEKKKADKKKTKDIDEHPLNLPPEELRRLSARMARDEKRSSTQMDVDVDSESAQPDLGSQDSQPTTPGDNTPGAFPTSEKLSNGDADSDTREQTKSPPPPLHRINIQPKMDPEAAKAAGNKFFKAKDYGRAVVEYSKGVHILQTLTAPQLT